MAIDKSISNRLPKLNGLNTEAPAKDITAADILKNSRDDSAGPSAWHFLGISDVGRRARFAAEARHEENLSCGAERDFDEFMLPDPTHGVGDAVWTGAWDTSCWINPREKLVGLLMTQSSSNRVQTHKPP